jgi:hypothetical protein
MMTMMTRHASNKVIIDQYHVMPFLLRLVREGLNFHYGLAILVSKFVYETTSLPWCVGEFCRLSFGRQGHLRQVRQRDFHHLPIQSCHSQRLRHLLEMEVMKGTSCVTGLSSVCGGPSDMRAQLVRVPLSEASSSPKRSGFSLQH